MPDNRTMMTIPAQHNGHSAKAVHMVRFYDDEEDFVSLVVSFLGAGQAAGTPALVLAMPAHRESIQRQLAMQFPALPVTFVDAAQALEQIRGPHGVDAARFQRLIGDLLDRLGPGPVRVYGELVALLAGEGKHEEAIALECFWNDLAQVRTFELFCGYPLSVFPDAEHTHALRRICDAHSHTVPSAREENISAADLAVLRQKARALDPEIARRTDAERTARDERNEFREFVENAAEGLHKVGPDGTILWANRAELDLMGYEAHEYVGEHISRFHADDHVIRDILARLLAGNTLRNYPARLRCKDGSIKHVLIQSNARIEDGRVMYTRCFTRDITDRIALAQVEQERNDLLQEAPAATALLVGAEHRFELANPLYKEMVGRHDLEGMKFADAFPAPRHNDMVRTLDRVYETGEPFVAHEYPLPVAREGNGTLVNRFYRLNLQPLRRVSGAVYGVMALAVDVTELVNARDRQEMARQERERLLAELRSAATAKDEFLAMLGHELRNPLAPIVTALEIMKRRGDIKTSKEQDVILRQVQHLIRLVDDLLDVSRIARGKVTLRVETTELGPVLAAAVEMVNLLMEQQRHVLSTDFPLTGLPWNGDPVRLAQVVNNLLTNAARYTPPGGQIHLAARRERQEVVITVADNGRGMPPDVVPRIFDLFFQGDRRLERVGGGLGVGLALVKSLVTAHGGSVHAASDGPGLGSIFTVRLPLAQEAAPARPVEPDTAGDVEGPPRRVLIVDDNEDAADLLADFLRSSGHDVRVAYEPAAALNLGLAFEPEFAILDIGMPVMDGYELAKQLRAELGPARAPKIYSLTGFGQPADLARSAAAGLDGHFVKPVDAAQVIAALKG
jgi:PAS domain S-box-containing protein